MSRFNITFSQGQASGGGRQHGFYRCYCCNQLFISFSCFCLLRINKKISMEYLNSEFPGTQPTADYVPEFGELVKTHIYGLRKFSGTQQQPFPISCRVRNLGTYIHAFYLLPVRHFAVRKLPNPLKDAMHSCNIYKNTLGDYLFVNRTVTKFVTIILIYIRNGSLHFTVQNVIIPRLVF